MDHAAWLYNIERLLQAGHSLTIRYYFAWPNVPRRLCRTRNTKEADNK
jgi:hypothetical protein